MKKSYLLSRLFTLLLVTTFLLSFTAIGISANEISLSHSHGGLLTVHYLDVGQADSILIELPNGETMLIDAGNNGDSESIINYLRSQEVERIDYLVGTHPHEDHIGALDDVIDTFEIGKIYMPYAAANTKTFKDVLTAVEDKGLTVQTAKYGVSLFDGEILNAEFIAPVSEKYANLNNYSAVLVLNYGDVRFLFSGDAEELSESEILSRNTDLKSTVLKVGHHGSDTSTSEQYLDAVDPSYAVISCGVGNTYGHPSAQTLDRLYGRGVSVYRTDLQGTVVAKSNGTGVSFKTVSAVSSIISSYMPNKYLKTVPAFSVR